MEWGLDCWRWRMLFWYLCVYTYYNLLQRHVPVH